MLTFHSLAYRLIFNSLQPPFCGHVSHLMLLVYGENRYVYKVVNCISQGKIATGKKENMVFSNKSMIPLVYCGRSTKNYLCCNSFSGSIVMYFIAWSFTLLANWLDIYFTFVPTHIIDFLLPLCFLLTDIIFAAGHFIRL